MIKKISEDYLFLKRFLSFAETYEKEEGENLYVARFCHWVFNQFALKSKEQDKNGFLHEKPDSVEHGIR